MLKRKEKGTETEQRDVNNLCDLDLGKYCPLKLFNVLFVNATDEYSNKIISKIIDVSREYEDISYLTFITYDEVINLVKNCDDAVLPPLLKSILKDVSKTVKDNFQEGAHLPAPILARLMKIKLIEVMYAQYANAVIKMQKRRKLVTDLKALTVESSKAKGKFPKVVESKPHLSSKKVESQVITDYTSIPIEMQDDIIFDDDIHHHIYFYIFHGFYDMELLRELIVNNNVNIQSILKVSSQSPDKMIDRVSNVFSDYWYQVYKYFDGPTRRTFLENTFLMTYTPAGNDIQDIFEELLYVIRSISDIKLHHLNYIRHMELFRSTEIYSYFPLECFTVYNNFLHKFPMELISVPVLLDTLLKQVSVGVDETFIFSQKTSQHSHLDVNDTEKYRCTNPCSIEAFFKHKVKSRTECSSLWKPPVSFLTHENDELTIVLNSYKKYGSLVYDITTRMLKNVCLVKDLNEFEANCTEVIHKHDIDPSTKTIVRDKDIVLHFLYLYLFSWFDHKHILPKVIETDLTKNLETYNKLEFVKRSQTRILENDRTDEEIIEGNLYNTSSTEYFWKEKLGTTVLLQEMFKAQKEYSFWDKKFSPETDTMLVQFSNRLDEFGVNTIVYDQSVLTPVCLRDFCKYVTVEKAEWLEKNKPPKYVRKCIVREECQGARKIIDQKLFPEYHYLIETNQQKETQPDQSHFTNAENEISFEQLIEEIKKYPSNYKITKECLKSDKKDKFLVYDFGTKYFQIKGAQTTFHSHDDVRLTIDNTRMLDEYPKCSLNLNCRNNSLVLHSNKFYLTEDYNFHMNLADGTIVSFIFLKRGKSKSLKLKESVVFETGKAEDETPTESVESTFEHFAETVLFVDQDYFEGNVETSLLNEEYTSSTEIAFKSSENMLQRLKEAATTKAPIYKVSKNTTFVKKLRSEFEVPLATIVKRVLHNATSKEEIEPFTKMYLPIVHHKNQTEPKWGLDTRITLPNGLYISFYPSKLKRDQKEVKQEFLCRNVSTELEEFRLFTRGGYILIKKIDGSITVLKSNGDAMDHEKLDTNSKDVHKFRTKPCHCKNIEDYKKRVSKLLKSQNEEEVDIAVSRRGLIQSKKGYVLNSHVADILKNNKVPYLKSSLLKFDGTRVCLDSGKIRVKKTSHVTTENNFVKQEIYYERSDGFRSTIDVNGSQIVEFVDGTKIKSVVHVANELVDGYVYISLEFEYQHPSYATVAYMSDGSLEIQLNNVVVRRETEEVSVKIDNDIVTTVKKEKVLFEKQCSKCNGKYICDINIQPLVCGEFLFFDKFVDVRDSYNKRFYANLAGYCERNRDYIKGAINAFNCNHYDNMCYKKMFVVNRDLSGYAFWTDNMVIAKKEAMSLDENSSLNEYDDVINEKIRVYKFKRNVYDHYSNRYLGKDLDVYRPLGDKALAFSTFCIVKRMLDTKTIEKFCQDLTNYFQRAGNVDSKHCNTLTKMFKESEAYCERQKESFVRIIPVEVEPEKCTCVKQRISIREKIERWRKECDKYRTLIRNRDLPCYFDSPFCKIIKK